MITDNDNGKYYDRYLPPSPPAPSPSIRITRLQSINKPWGPIAAAPHTAFVHGGIIAHRPSMCVRLVLLCGAPIGVSSLLAHRPSVILSIQCNITISHLSPKTLLRRVIFYPQEATLQATSPTCLWRYQSTIHILPLILRNLLCSCLTSFETQLLTT